MNEQCVVLKTVCVCVCSGKWEVEEMKDTKLLGDKGLVLKSRAKHHAISALLLRPFTFDTKPLIVQWVNADLHEQMHIWTDLSVHCLYPAHCFQLSLLGIWMNCSGNVSWTSCSILVFRYEVNFQNGIDCGGAYVKLLSQSADLNLVRHFLLAV